MKKIIWLVSTVMFASCGEIMCECLVPLPEHDVSVYQLSPDKSGVFPGDDFNIGYRVWQTSYVPKGETAERTINVNVWYPTNDAEGDEAEFLDGVPNTNRDPESFQDAEPAIPLDGYQYPVLVFSHGHIGWGGNGTYIARYFARRGWLVVAPDHIGNTILTNLDPREAGIYLHRAQDLSASLDALGDLPQEDSLYGLAYTDAVMAMGHSFGSYSMWSIAGAAYDVSSTTAECINAPEPDCTDAQRAALLAGLRDARVQVMATTGGGNSRNWFGPEGEQAVTIPVLVMHGSLDGEDSALEWPKVRTIEAPTHFAQFEGGCHHTFEYSPLNPTCAYDDETPGLRGDKGWDLVNTVVMSMAQRYLLGSQDTTVRDILNGKIEFSPLVAVEAGDNVAE